jgi:hypothetical protein
MILVNRPHRTMLGWKVVLIAIIAAEFGYGV